MATDHIRYRGDSFESLATALVVVLQYARESKDVFKFGPVVLSSLVRDGLSLSGEDLSGVRQALQNVPGLILDMD